ncbi:MAG TPA: ABC transporter permease [Acidimicrobiales bacterium]|nr:ABC transporter permease [Acidimicrobiales bacterium]
MSGEQVGARRMSGWEATALVARRELREAFRRRSFWIVGAVLFVGSTAAMVVPALLHRGPGVDDVAVVGGSPALTRTLVAATGAGGARIRIVDAGDTNGARVAVEKGKVDVAVIAGAAAAGASPPVVYVKAGKHERLVALLQQGLARASVESRLADLGVSQAAAAGALDVAPARIDGVDPSADSRRAVAGIVATVLYILLLSLMIQAANGVAIEKANRISEVLLAIVKPGALLFGKVIGVGIIGTLTLAAGVVPIVVKVVTGGSLPHGTAPAVAGGAAWFLLGVALYLIVAGSLGALVERQEEAGSVVSPLTMILIGSFFVAQSSPDGSLARVLAYVPLSSPVVMPARIAVGSASPVEMAVSLVLGVAGVVLAARIGSIVYRRAIVRTGRRLTVGEVLRAAS